MNDKRRKGETGSVDPVLEHQPGQRTRAAVVALGVSVLLVALSLLAGGPQLLGSANASALRVRHPEKKTPTSHTFRIPQPTRARPLSILVIGDSLGLDLQYGLSQTLGADPLCHLIQAAVGDTGLTNASYYDWPVNLSREIVTDHPKLLVVMLGGNDWQGMDTSSGPVQPGTAIWVKNYNERVAELMSAATSKDVSVLWVGLPIMGDPSFSADMAILNAIYLAQARVHRGVSFAPTWKLFSTPSGAYAESLVVGGSVVQVRDPDGVHIDPPAGTALLGHYIVETVDSNWHIHI